MKHFITLCGLTLAAWNGVVLGQQVCLPAPRLMTIYPMGAQAGTTVEVTVGGQNIDDDYELLFSSPKIFATPKTGADGKPQAGKFVVAVAPDCPAGVYDARLFTRLGVSSARAFSVSALSEVTRTTPNTSLATALELKLNSVCNATPTQRQIDHYTFTGVKGKRLGIDCAAAGIDSGLDPVLIIADALGRDLLANRSGETLDFTPPADGKYVIKVHSLTYQGSGSLFYRLALTEAPASGPIPSQPATRTVGSASWNPDDRVSAGPSVREIEPNQRPANAQKITLPCEIAGAFFPAADVDNFEFAAKKGEVWWIEVVSERLGLPTDPFVLVQRVVTEGAAEKLVDVAELNDIASPVKVSSYSYSYDGPPYDAGSPDSLGMAEIKEDGVYRLQVRDLFGGTRSDPRNVYRLIVRRATPDFSLVAWALHMELRNGDRSALSKPIAMRKGATMAFDVVAIRRDGFTGPIDLDMEGLPAGVTATGLNIPAGKSHGTMLITAAADAPRSLAIAKMVGRAKIDNEWIAHDFPTASMAWPNSEVPTPRLMADTPVSVGGSESAALSIVAAEDKVWTAKAGEKLTIPLALTWRGEVAGSLRLKALGSGFEAVKPFDVTLNSPTASAVLDLAALKTPPGDYTIAFYGNLVSKHQHNPEGVKPAEEAVQRATDEANAATTIAKSLAEVAKVAQADRKATAEKAAKVAVEREKAAVAAKTAAERNLKTITDAAKPVDTADIVVSQPIRILIQPADKK